MSVIRLSIINQISSIRFDSYKSFTKEEQVGQYQKFPEYIKKKDKNYALHKVESSRKIVQNITASNSENVLDLKESIEKLYREIEKWNQAGDRP